MKNLDRSKYYKEDEEGFMIYLLSRLYNDLQINTALYNSISNKNNILSDNAEIYLFKILISHLKEGLKILGIMKRSPKYNTILSKWINSNKIIDEIMKDISDELENPKNYPSEDISLKNLTSKYLGTFSSILTKAYEQKLLNELYYADDIYVMLFNLYAN